MWESKSFQTKLPVFKRELAKDDRASFSASYVKTLPGGNRSLETLFDKIMIQDQLIMTLIDSGSIVNLLSDTLCQQLREPNQIRVCKKYFSCQEWRNACNGVNSYSNPTSNIFTSEITVQFLLTKIEITSYLLGMDFLYKIDCFLDPRKKRTL